VVGVVVGDDEVRDRLRRHLADLRQQALGQRRRTQGVDHHHARAGDDEAGVGDEVLVGWRAQRRQAFDIPAAGRGLARAHLGRGGGVVGRLGVARPGRPHAAQRQTGTALKKLTPVNHRPHDPP
jgi:hypothetical protein